ncbi:hypothetical protein KR032_002842 [Drosophila birchii]|nr:hypothetical protein KR032_002842 [Drosophila birchii]
MKFSKSSKRTIAFCGFAIIIVVVCFILVARFSGFQHEPKEYRAMLMTLLCVFIIDFLFWEPIRFIVLAIDHATWPSTDQTYTSEFDAEPPNHFTYLKTQLSSRRSEVLIPEEHRNEALNQKYKQISTDLFLYGSYFLALLLNILVAQDQSLYYLTDMVNRLFTLTTRTTIGLPYIYYQYQIYNFLAVTLVDAFNANRSVYGYDGWYAMEQWKLLGTIRLRQLRTPNKNVGTKKLEWDKKAYAPEWKLPYRRYHYTSKFWRVFEPFMPVDVEPDFINGLLLNYDHIGELMNYPEIGGYQALMMRPVVRMQLINYLRDTKWLDRRTVALFMDFSMYNTDAKALTIVTLRIENSPFGTQLTYVDVDCVRILGTAGTFTWSQAFLLGIYFILVLYFMRGLVKRLWYDRASIKRLWNIVDLLICLLNLFLLILYFWRELTTSSIRDMVQASTMEQYLGHQRPLRLHYLITITVGLLITITTLRLWKVLQFASVFQHFSETVFSAWKATISLGVAIVVSLMGLAIAMVVLNGNNAGIFRHIVNAVVACLWYSVGYNDGIDTTEMFHGGLIFGILLFLLLVFLVGIVLINVFTSVIYDYLQVTGRILKERQKTEKISFWQFLQAEYGGVFRRFLWCFLRHKKYHRRNHTVAENVAIELDNMEYKELQRSRGRYYKPKPRPTEEEQKSNYQRRIHLVISLNAVLEVQMELLERYLLGDQYGNIPTPPGSDEEYDTKKWGK